MPEGKPVLIERVGMDRSILHFSGGVTVVERLHPNGKPWYSVRRQGHHKDGLAEYWWPNGQMLRRETYRMGKLHGLLEGWKEDGTPTKRIEYINGVRHIAATR